MGFFDRFRRSSSSQQGHSVGAATMTARSTPASPQAAVPTQSAPVVHAVSRNTSWIPPGQPTTVAGYSIPGGLIYIGQHLTAANGQTEPALIDPTLRVDRKQPDWEGRGLDYWPSYETIPPNSRATYLTWLADGRRYAGAAAGYVFLFFYGLERRVLVEMPKDPTVRQELPAIAAEVHRLLGIYGDNNSFRSYASRFLDVVDLVGAARPDAASSQPPELAAERWPVPMQLRLALGEFAATGTPVPACWARAWAWYLPSLHPRTPQTRCAEEFDKLFAKRYAQRLKDGLLVRPGKSRIEFHYRTASAGIGAANAQLDLPDVLEQAAPTRKLTELVESVTDDLDAYSRWLGRNPDSAGSLAAAALLPAELLDERVGQLGVLRAWCEARLANEPEAVVDAAELVAFWPAANPDKMTKPEAVSLAQLLGRIGIGVEPDVRLGGSSLAAGPAVMFRVPLDAPHTAGPAYVAATTLLHLAVAVSASDGNISSHEQDNLVTHLQTALHLTAAERTRLQAHLRWLSVTGVKLTGLKKRLEALSADQRESIGDFLITVAAADGIISPEEVTTLTKIYKLLGLDPDLIYGRLHQRVTGLNPDTARQYPPATGPVVVRPAGLAPAGFAVPRTPPAIPQRPTYGNSQPANNNNGATIPAVVLNEDVIAAKLAETAAVSALLSTIFAEDETPPPEAASPPAPDCDEPAAGATAQNAPDVLIAGLDVVHSQLLRALAAQPAWTRSAYEELAERHGVMPDGALDVLNETAMDASGEPVAEGEDDIVINDYALQELLR